MNFHSTSASSVALSVVRYRNAASTLVHLAPRLQHAVDRLGEVVGRRHELKSEKPPRLDLQDLSDVELSPNARTIRAGSVTMAASALTHWTWDESRWFVGPPPIPRCHEDLEVGEHLERGLADRRKEV